MSNLEQINYILDSLDVPISTEKPSEWAEKNRVLTSEVTSFPGKVSFDRFPFWREPLDCLSPDNPIRIITIMGGAQIGKSTNFIENGIGYIIKNCPGNILLTSADKELSKGQMSKKIDQMIEHSGLRFLIRPNTIKRKNLKTGDRDDLKEFPGGSLSAQSIKAVDKIKQNSFRFIFADDLEAAIRAGKQAGDVIDLLFMRANSFKDKMKICMLSTPEIKQNSVIEPAFLLSDQRYYLVPCPKCGAFIQLIWYKRNDDKSIVGVTFEKDGHNNVIEKSVGYVCQECGNFFTEKHKRQMLHDGYWNPTAIPSRPDWAGFHISALYSPPGFFDWTHYARQWVKIFPGNGIVKTRSLQVFYNLVLGLTFEERGRTPKIIQIARNIRDYKIGIVPQNLSVKDGNGNIVILTCSCDCNGKVDDARLDYEIIGHAENGSTYSIDSGSIGTFKSMDDEIERELYTYRNNEKLNVWDIFDKEVLKKKYLTDKGTNMVISCVGVDTGSFTHYTNSFIDEHINDSIPIMYCGLKGEKDKVRKIGADTYIYRKSHERNHLYLLEVNQIKDDLANRMDLSWKETSGLPQPDGFMNFPNPESKKYTLENYFSHFEGEHKVEHLNTDGTLIGHVWKKRHSTVQNHFWDVFVYNIALRDIFSDTICQELKLKNYDWATFCNALKQKSSI